MGIRELLGAGKAPLEEPEPPAPATKPRGGSGRGHTRGFLELEEFNPDLRHPVSHRVFDKMYRTDGDCRQAISMALNPILAGVWEVEPYGGREADDKAIEQAKALEWAMWEEMCPDLIGHLSEFLPVVMRSGFCPGEKVWRVAERDGKRLLVLDYIGMRLPRSVWRWEEDDRERLTRITQYLPAGSPAAVGVDFEYTGQYGSGTAGSAADNGERTIEAKDLIYYRVGAEGNNWEGVSLLRPAYKHWYFKDLIERIDAVGQEREALGVPLLYPPPGADDTLLDGMEEVLKNFRTAKQGYIVMPGMKAGAGAPDGAGWLLELIGFDRTGSGRDPMPSLEYHGKKIAASFIEEFMRLGHGQSGARATAQVQADPFLLSIEVLSGLVERRLHEDITRPFVAYNFGKVDGLPRIKNSLIDASSLSQLADYALKLIQVGALLPDQELEDFFRRRGDLPPPDPDAVRERGDKDGMIRREVAGGNVDPTPKDDAAAESAEKLASLKPAPGDGAGGSPPRKAGAPKGPGGAGKGRPRGPAKNLSAAEPVEIGEHSSRFPHARPFEQLVDLDSIEDSMDDMPRLLEHECSPYVYDMARAMGSGADADADPLRDAIHRCLDGAYDLGGEYVRDELAAQGFDASGVQLDAGARDRGRGHLTERAAIAAERVELAMRSALVGHDLAHGQAGRAQAAAERAGRAVLRGVGQDHAVPALVHGRHDEAVALSGDVRLKATYTSILDRGTCDHCWEADDGVARELDDPVRLEHRPPNPHCESLASGFNKCRCFEVYEIAD